MSCFGGVPVRHRLAFAALIFVIASTMPAQAAKRWAFVIGIDIYQSRWPQLKKAVGDARDVAAILGSSALDFTVDLRIERENTTQAAIRAGWSALLRNVQKGDVVLFYFAGHGLELEGHNYLVPIDGELNVVEGTQDVFDAEQAKLSSLSFQELLEDLAATQEQTGAVGIFVIDACRENPFRWKGSTGKVIKGNLVGPVRPPQQMIVLYSAGIGQKAHDGGPSDANSVYASYFIPMLTEPNLPLSELAQRIRHSVYLKAREYRNEQTPAYYDQLGTRLSILGSPSAYVEPATIQRTDYEAAARGAGVGDVVIDCAFCPEMVVLDAGHFLMGAPDSEREGAANERPQHRVDISRRFAIGKFEVTNREWNECVRARRCDGMRDLSDPRQSLSPVTGVSWQEARKYTAWLSEFTGRTYRLPSEAEWEFAARAGTTSPYSFDDTASPICDFANGADRSVGALLMANASCDDNVGRAPAQRGSYLPNPRGLHDVHGNVWEWVDDCWYDTYDGAPGDGAARNNLSGTSECRLRVARGGSWRSGPAALRSAVRHAFPPDHGRATLGFRVVREIGAD